VLGSIGGSRNILTNSIHRRRNDRIRIVDLFEKLKNAQKPLYQLAESDTGDV
jgi:hypothetical protein